MAVGSIRVSSPTIDAAHTRPFSVGPIKEPLPLEAMFPFFPHLCFLASWFCPHLFGSQEGNTEKKRQQRKKKIPQTANPSSIIKQKSTPVEKKSTQSRARNKFCNMSKIPRDEPSTDPCRSSPCMGRSFDREHSPLARGGCIEPSVFCPKQPARPTREDTEAQKRFYEEHNKGLLAGELSQSE